jgi:hypothetical protein
MSKEKDARIREAQGRKSRQTAKLHQLGVLVALVNKPSTFSELLKRTGFSKPVLAKHLKFWMKNEVIYRDTIKPNEAKNPKDVGKIVYRMISGEIIPEMITAMETTLQLPEPHWNEESKAKLRKNLEAIANIILDERQEHTL